MFQPRAWLWIQSPGFTDNATAAMKANLLEIEGNSVHHSTQRSNARWPFAALLQKSHVLTALMVIEAGVPITLVRQPSYRR